MPCTNLSDYFEAHGQVVITAISEDTPTGLRLLDLGQRQKMMSCSCHLHMLCANRCRVILGVLVAIHGRHDRTISDHRTPTNYNEKEIEPKILA